VLVRQVDELGDGCSLVVHLLLQELFSSRAGSHTGPQHPEAVGVNILKGERLALGGVEADGWPPLTKESQRLLQCQLIRAEDVDVVKVGQDEPVWPNGQGKVSEQ
jgi:hypothetical protein